MKFLFVAAIVCCAIILAESSDEKPQDEEKLVHDVKNGTDFDQQLEDAGNKLVVVKFYATWCFHSDAIAPRFEELAKEHAENVVFLNVDVDERKDLKQKYNVFAYPTFIFIKNKEKLDELIGADEKKLDEDITKYV